MTEILFIQGAGKGAHDEWDINLVESLQHDLGPDYNVRFPLMPNEADPKFATWRPVVEKEISNLRDGDIVVGHSMGGTMMINTLAETLPPSTLGAIMLLAAPFIGDGGWDSEEIKPGNDLAKRLPSGVPIFLFHGDADTTAPIAHMDLYSQQLPGAHVRHLAGRDHQLNNNLAEVAKAIRELNAPA